jgi:hypothetical protein
MAKVINEHLEEAILNLPQKEKNKLLLRLIRKDKILTEQLHFKLLEHPEFDLKLRENDILDQINKILDSGSTYSFYNLLLIIRKLFGEIRHHEKITADKVGEVRLSVWLARIITLNYPQIFEGVFTRDQVKINNFIIKKIPGLIKKYQKIHEDYKIEFQDHINEILDFLYLGHNKYYLKETAVPREV